MDIGITVADVTSQMNAFMAAAGALVVLIVGVNVGGRILRFVKGLVR
jgi:hypothetical protein